MTIMLSAGAWAHELSGKAVLVEGTSLSEGLPGFVPNRIPALSGRYVTESGVFVSVWAVTEPLVFNPEYWQEKPWGRGVVRYRQTEDRKQVWCVLRAIPVREGMAAYSRVSFLMCTGAEIGEDACRGFFDSFLERTEFFFSSANRVADLSFPATLEAAGK